ncbi:hypothetical protein C8Q73DRAFT_682773 [Cubamyces lactineus]|nr:hypothetical protein C8Q73DRAFT_682773 [Cubamyces lactineus]
MALPYLVVSRAPSLILFGTLEAALASFVWYQWQKPRSVPALTWVRAVTHLSSRSLISGPLPSAIPKGYIGKARFQHHEMQPIHIAQGLRH